MTSVVAVVQLSNRNRRCCGSSPNTTSSNHNNGEQDMDKHGIYNYKGFLRCSTILKMLFCDVDVMKK